MFFRLGSDQTPLQLIEEVSQEERDRITAFFAKCDDPEYRRDFYLEVPATPEDICERLRVTDYLAYQKSKLWKQIRAKVLSRDNSVCIMCNKEADTVHHRLYTVDVMLGNDNTKLVSVCETCHRAIHFEEDGTKRHHDDWEKVLLDRCFDPNSLAKIEPFEW